MRGGVAVAGVVGRAVTAEGDGEGAADAPGAAEPPAAVVPRSGAGEQPSASATTAQAAASLTA